MVLRWFQLPVLLLISLLFLYSTSNVRHPRCVLYNSKELGILTLTIEHNYIHYYIIGVYNNDMFRTYIWAIIRLWLDLELRLY